MWNQIHFSIFLLKEANVLNPCAKCFLNITSPNPQKFYEMGKCEAQVKNTAQSNTDEKS